MDIRINEELRAYIDPLTEDEFAALERSLLAEGCRDALVLWGDLLVDGHNRYTICQKHGLPFETVQNTRFETVDDVHLWMIDNHLGRRSVSDFQRGVLALRKKDIIASRAQAAAQQAGGAADAAGAGEAGADASQPALKSREAIAREARISSTTVSQIEKIRKTAAPELVAAVKSGTISINAAAAVASLPADEQAAAAAGGKKELRDAARRVRAAKTPTPRKASGAQAEAAGATGLASDASAASDGTAPWESAATDAESAELTRLRTQVAVLTDENAMLRQRVAELTTALREANTAT